MKRPTPYRDNPNWWRALAQRVRLGAKAMAHDDAFEAAAKLIHAAAVREAARLEETQS